MVDPPPLVKTEPSAPETPGPSAEEANAWAQLSKNEQFTRTQGRLRTVARKEDHRPRGLTNPTVKE
jgi:hypothetical protein